MGIRVPYMGKDQAAETQRQLHRKRKRESRDWCSRWPDEVNGKNYGDCCRKHDWRYAQPGDRHDRAKADRELRECVSIRAGKFMGTVMWLGTRLFGWTPWHFNRTIFGRRLDEEERKKLDDRFEFKLGP